jgi:type IV secretion system protein VirD4
MSFLMGLKDRTAIWAGIESAGLILSPAGGGKTVCFVIPALLGNASSMFVADLKGTLATITGRARAKRLGHKVHYVNPAGLYEDRLGPSARFNALQLLVDAWADPRLHRVLVSDAQKVAGQLVPEPKESGENQYFRAGSRKLLVFGMLYLLVRDGTVNLPALLVFLSDMDAVRQALILGQTSDDLCGDITRYAKDLHEKAAEGNERQMESFREGALQALESFAPSGLLADSVSESDFSFTEMRDGSVTIYVIADPTNQDVFATWLGLMTLNAVTALMHYQTNRPVTFMLDEVTNFKVEGLPKLLTSAREFQLRMWLVVQELEQFSALYGKEGLDTLLSQTEVKLIHGSRSQKTCELVSQMCGETSIRSESFGLGHDHLDRPNMNVSEQAKRIITADEVRRLDQAILFHKTMPPLLLDKVGYHEIAPWKRWADPNPLFGNKRFRGRTLLRV